MGNQNSKVGHDQHSQLLDQLCSLTNQDYPRTYNLSFDPFPQLQSRDILSSTTDFPISSMVDEMEDTQPMRTAFDPQGVSPSGSSGQGRGTWGLQKNNQTSNKLPKKIKKINKRNTPIHKKNTKNHFSSQNPQDGESNSNETAVEQGIRDQNNCKSYHKLVKNFLIEKGLGSLIDKYEPKYHTRYYFIVALLIIKNHLPSVNFPALYQTIVEGELAIQQRKIDRKAVELATIKAKLESMVEGGALKVKEGNLENQIEHIKVVKHEIASYSVNSCRAFFEGNVEESLRILYLKNDPVMRKKYYFDEALEIVRKIQLEMRKSHSHR